MKNSGWTSRKIYKNFVIMRKKIKNFLNPSRKYEYILH